MATGIPVLDRILEVKAREVAALRAAFPAALVDRAADAAAPPRDFAAALRAGAAPRCIAELKRASPSAGVIRPDFDVEALARAYRDGGAACLSVLTDVSFFWGQPDYLRRAAAVSGLPCLRKDFVLDPWQVDEARALGADAVLLIVAALPDDGLLRGLREQIEGRGMAALVEVHDAPELERALRAGATLVGVNNRDLRTMKVDLAAGEALLRRIPAPALAVAESGIASPADVRRMTAAGARALLVGEALVRQDDPGAALRALLQEG
jgi:indole-3-glycerol phosphate synthase